MDGIGTDGGRGRGKAGVMDGMGLIGRVLGGREGKGSRCNIAGRFFLLCGDDVYLVLSIYERVHTVLRGWREGHSVSG